MCSIAYCFLEVSISNAELLIFPLWIGLLLCPLSQRMSHPSTQILKPENWGSSNIAFTPTESTSEQLSCDHQPPKNLSQIYLYFSVPTVPTFFFLSFHHFSGAKHQPPLLLSLTSDAVPGHLPTTEQLCMSVPCYPSVVPHPGWCHMVSLYLNCLILHQFHTLINLSLLHFML